jgi:hypothetical protein
MKLTKIILLIAPLTFFGASLSFSQDAKPEDTKAADDTINSEPADIKAADSTAAEKPVPDSSDSGFKHNSPKAAMYDDGVTTFTNTRVKYQITATDNAKIDKSFYKVNEEAEQEYKAPFPVLKEGPQKIQYYSIDKMGNREQEKNLAVTVDNTPPVAMVKTDKPVYQAENRYFVSPDYLFTVMAKDSASGAGLIQYSVDGNSYSSYSASFKIKDLKEASLKIRSSDNVLNTTDSFSFQLKEGEETAGKAAADIFAFTIDDQAPSVEIKPDGELKQKDGKNMALASYRYTISAQDAGAGLSKIYYRIDKAEAWVLYEKPVEFSIYGEHRIEAMAVDNVGNSSAPVSLSLTVDIVPPDTNDTVAE